MLEIILQIFLTTSLVAISLAIHEYAHVFAIKFMGAKIEGIGIFPLGLMAKVRGLETLHWWERYVIYAAGSTANFAVAIMAFAISQISYVGVPWLETLALYCLALGAFNLMPALPLDGGRILWQILGNKIGILRASRFVARLGLFVSGGFVLLGIAQVILFPPNITLLLAGAYLFWKNKKISPELHAAFHIMLGGKNSPARSRTLPTREISTSPDMSIKHALERLAPDYFIIFRIGKRHPLHENTLMGHIFDYGISGTVKEIMCYTTGNQIYATKTKKIGLSK